MSRSTESIVEQIAVGWLERLGWSVRHGLEIAAVESMAEQRIGRIG